MCTYGVGAYVHIVGRRASVVGRSVQGRCPPSPFRAGGILAPLGQFGGLFNHIHTHCTLTAHNTDADLESLAHGFYAVWQRALLLPHRPASSRAFPQAFTDVFPTCTQYNAVIATEVKGRRERISSAPHLRPRPIISHFPMAWAQLSARDP